MNDTAGSTQSAASAQAPVAAGERRTVITNRMRFLDKTAPRWIAPVGILIILIVWQVVTGLNWVSQADLPSPVAIVKAGIQMIQNGTLWLNVGASLARIAIGYLLGAGSGIIIGIILGFSRISERVGIPIANALYPIPKLAIIPLIILWIGAGESSKILVIAAEVLFPVVFNTYSAVRNTDPSLIRAAVGFGAPRRTVITRVIIPASLPTIFAGLRIGAGLSLLVLVAAEMIGAQHGIGAMILQYSSLMMTANVLVGVVLLSILGLLISRGLAQLERWLLPWKSQ
ncbi:ABC transporter permease [Alicyclobacillus cycloheptanicus]|uniref:NitT/TauT family transport system permease protein n=1 Tax=Alicyclobacillus cycloheptanicus TaxID=1457 RepID=A0ABT9XI88_9BACL|nr:ABC transporter permease [Alicyclobacillus cycloheptanicus]MDQ0189830.1 NitT/TauT family transport system permease protein [Alicyclobacillus cycloheptanicus]WDM02483.1 ABC transporter permease [Alicyclobacillus cycloheptanicus]